ncbi:Chaperone protein dnaJ 49 [Cardamine amara subsp. amara]|uniref:Chaperone protein dnaJ 49 n=1 Tax=Cardamine amara subsp. amara TaxID=228776 RepID=A0ABD1B6I1_CARAN
MECNKDEAKRAMDIAERKITEKDYNGAKKFANKAQNLFPNLDGLKQLLMTVEVYISGEKKIAGEADWYGILGVDPCVEDEALRKQYRKLALMLHPDKNKCKGADGAFNLLSEAWSLLSDSSKRKSYNDKRQVKGSQQRYPTTHSGIPPHQRTSNGFPSKREPVILGNRPKPRGHMDRSSMGSPSPSSVPPTQKESSTFWTKCDKCRTQYEYLRMYVNQALLCPNCRGSFIAAEKNPPSNIPKAVNLSSNQQHRSTKNQAANKRSSGTSGREPAASANYNFGWDSGSRRADFNSQNAANQAANLFHQAQDRAKRGFGESQERDAARGFTNSDLWNFKRSKTDDSQSGPFSGKWSNQTGVSRFGTSSNPTKGNIETPNTIGSRHPHLQGMLLPSDISKALLNKVATDILKRLPKMTSDMEEKVKGTEIEKKSVKATSKANEVEMPVEKTPYGSVEEKDDDVQNIVVPDSDFHIFDLDRSESSFKDDEIWAAYDDDDGMPRYFARIQKVISVNPFKLRISWLNSKSTSEFGPQVWTAYGFAKSCGEFRAGRYEASDTLNTFSHRVDFTKGSRGLLHIYPKKGQVWALYRNWSSEWDKDTPDEVIHKYDMVEVLDDYTEDKQSLTVVLLLKAEGFKAVFYRSTDEKDVRKIVKEEMFRFSHQVPHYILTGKEADNVQAGYLELDPAATPCELVSENAKTIEKNETVKEKSSIPKEEEAMDLD